LQSFKFIAIVIKKKFDAAGLLEHSNDSRTTITENETKQQFDEG